MRLTNVFSGRPAYYDRNPTNVSQIYQATIAPAGDTSRWSYTVPSGRKAMVEAVFDAIIRASAAGAVGDVNAYQRHTPNGGSAMPRDFADIQTNGIGDKNQVSAGGGQVMVAGDILNGRTADASTTGTITFFVHAKMTEFDA